MENIKDLCNKFKTLKSKNKVQDKIDTLDEYASDFDFCYLLEYLLNDDKISGIRKGKLNKTIKNPEKLKQVSIPSVKALIIYLLEHNTGKDQEVYATQNLLSLIEDKDDRQLIADIITKDFKCGVTDLTAYGHIPGLERNWRERKGYALTEDKAKKLIGKNVTVTLKLDGYRYKVAVNEDTVTIYSSSGKKVKGLVEIEEEAKQLPDGVYDGEMIAHGAFKDSTARFNATTKILGSDGEKRGVDFICFDYINNIDTFLEYEVYKKRRANRLDELKSCLSLVKDLKYMQLVPVYYNDEILTEELLQSIYDAYESVVAQGEEGLVIDLADAFYERKKGTNMYKLKPEKSGDFKVVDMVEGKGKDAGRLGAFIIEYKGNTVNVGSGLTDEIREEVWANQEFYLNKLIEVIYLSETQDENGNYSLRLPRFKRFRHDKNDVSYE